MPLYKTCSVFGHTNIEITEVLKDKLTRKFEYMIERENFGIFYFGAFGDFDSLCYEVISALKQKYHHLRRVFCLFDPRHQRISKRPKWLRDQEYEEYIYLDLEFDWWYQRIYYRNIEMINQSDCIIFYVTNTENSGAYKAMQYAMKKKKDFINIALNED